MIAEAIALEMSKLDREARAKIAIKMASAQMGEAFANLDRRHDSHVSRGADRRARPQQLMQEAA